MQTLAMILTAICLQQNAEANLDRFGDPLPQGAFARLGTTKLRHGHSVHDAVFSPDEKLLATAGLHPTVMTWDAKTGNKAGEFDVPDVSAFCVCFSSDSTLLAAGCSDGAVRIWNAVDGTLQAVLQLCDKPIIDVRFSPDGRNLLSLFSPYAANVLDDMAPPSPLYLTEIASGRRLQIAGRRGFGTDDYRVSPDGRFIAVNVDSNGVAVWDFDTGDRLHESKFGFSSKAPLFSPDSRYLARLAGDRVRVTETQSGREIMTISRPDCWHDPAYWFSPDSRRLACFDKDEVRIYALPSETPMTILSHDDEEHFSYLRSAVFMPDGAHLITATVGPEPQLRKWNVATGELEAIQEGFVRNTILSRIPGSKVVMHRPGVQPGWCGNCNFGLFRQYGRMTFPANLQIREASTDKLLISHETSYRTNADWTATATGSAIASWGAGPTIRLWEAQTGSEATGMYGHDGEVSSLAFTDDGRLLCSYGNQDASIRLWDASEPYSQRFVANFHRQMPVDRDNYGFGHEFAVSPDGRWIAAVSYAGRHVFTCVVHLWDASSGQETVYRVGDGQKSVELSSWIGFRDDKLVLLNGESDKLTEWTVPLTELGEPLQAKMEPETATGSIWRDFVAGVFRPIRDVWSWLGTALLFFLGASVVALMFRRRMGGRGPLLKVIALIALLSTGLALIEFSTVRNERIGERTAEPILVEPPPEPEPDLEKLPYFEAIATPRPILEFGGFLFNAVDLVENGRTLAVKGRGRFHRDGYRYWQRIGDEYLPLEDPPPRGLPLPPIEQRREYKTLAVSSDGKLSGGVKVATTKDIEFAYGRHYEREVPVSSQIAVWDADTGDVLFEAEHAGAVGSMAFAPDGKTLATGSSDSTILLWDIGSEPRNGRR